MGQSRDRSAGTKERSGLLRMTILMELRQVTGPKADRSAADGRVAQLEAGMISAHQNVLGRTQGPLELRPQRHMLARVAARSAAPR
jgi:hypothetical protein